MDITHAFIKYTDCLKTPSAENADKFMNDVKTKDIAKDGFLHMGLCDTYKFKLWKIFGANMPVIRDYFGPLYIVTDTKTAEEVLKLVKNTHGDEKEQFIGNRSAKIIKKQVGKNNLFGCDKTDFHDDLRLNFKDALQDAFAKTDSLQTSIHKIMLPHVRTWLGKMSNFSNFELKKAVDELVAIFFVLCCWAKIRLKQTYMILLIVQMALQKELRHPWKNSNV